MKKILLLLCVTSVLCIMSFFTAHQTVAQNSTIYNNEWIDYSRNYFRMEVVKEGVHRIPYSTLEKFGVALEGNSLKMYHNGQEIPLYLTTTTNLSDGDYIEFYGEKNDGTLDHVGYARRTQGCLGQLASVAFNHRNTMESKQHNTIMIVV